MGARIPYHQTPDPIQGDRQPHRKKPREDTGRDWSRVAKSREVTKRWEKARGTPQDLGQQGPADTLPLGFRPPELGEKMFLVPRL